MRARVASHHLSRALFDRAACSRAQNEFTLASADLEAAREIVERGEMKLFLADDHLEAGKLQMAMGKKEKAKEHLAIAKEMIEKMGYGSKTEALQHELKTIQTGE